MGVVILQLLPLALGAISPVMILLIVLFLASKGGMAKSLAFIAGKYLTYVLWGLVFLGLMDTVGATGESGEPSTVSLVIKILLGGLLLILALKTYLGEDDPDAPPPKLLTVLDKMGPGKLFLVGILLSIIQLRFVALVLAGVVIIATAQLPAGQNAIAILILALLMVWPMLIPVVVFLAMGDRRDAALGSMNAWLDRNSRIITVMVLGAFGLILLWSGVSGLFL
jgi:hypothetical protein